MLAERAMANQEPSTDGLKVWRDAAQEQIAEPVIDACLFTRPTSYAANAIASHSGPVVGMLLRKSRKDRAGGLPEHFVFAVTEDEVVVLERKMKARAGALGEARGEVARFKRADLGVTWKPFGFLIKATVSVGGEHYQCSVVKHELSEAFLRLLSDPQDMSAAA
jgi:hypothetical protein